MKVLRAINGCIESALLWKNFYVNTLKYLRSSINIYDRCLYKKTIDGKQCNVVWYVDYNNLLHVDPNVVTDILEEIKKQFGDLVIIRGDTNDLLGVDIKIRKENKVELIMKHQIEDAVRKFKIFVILR